MSRLTPDSFDYTPDDVPPSSLSDSMGDEWRDANPEQGFDPKWEQAKRDFVKKWLPLINMRVKQAS